MELSKYKSELFEQTREKKIRDAEFLDDPEYKGVKAAIVDPYSERGHFIYELLQNADDARATKVSIVLHKDELWFKHNGSKHFDITPIRFYPPGDLNAILNIGSSPKELDENKIGKFGIGFKSVFSFSDAPEIYDDVYKLIRDLK